MAKELTVYAVEGITSEQYLTLVKIAEKFGFNITDNKKLPHEIAFITFNSNSSPTIGALVKGSNYDDQARRVDYNRFIELITQYTAPIKVGINDNYYTTSENLIKVGCVEIDSKKLEEILVTWREMNPE